MSDSERPGAGLPPKSKPESKKKKTTTTDGRSRLDNVLSTAQPVLLKVNEFLQVGFNLPIELQIAWVPKDIWVVPKNEVLQGDTKGDWTFRFTLHLKELSDEDLVTKFAFFGFDTAGSEAVKVWISDHTLLEDITGRALVLAYTYCYADIHI